MITTLLCILGIGLICFCLGWSRGYAARFREESTQTNQESFEEWA